MTEIDWIIIAVLALSTIVGIVRGVMREVLAIAGWVIGILLAMNFSGDLALHIPLESIGWLPRVMIAAVLILVAVLFVCGLLGLILRRMLEVASITFEDRALGAVFGLIRGIVVVCACVFLFGMPASIHESRMWQQSVLIGPAETLIDWSMPYLPKWIADMRGSSRA
ncbi:CvpA family protein [Sutterella sp.]|uniref:CvpA family protein n=1 Tax=Sutterella sp. TaxID=1981025 RepID=UPI0026DFB857|nr:CvpA family protein [Sutterella sp.]MDO5531781.1 CvpA family protein [Sutterella sp.]